MAERVTQKPVGRTPVPGQPPLRQVQNYTFVWLDSNIDETQHDVKHSLSQIRCIVTITTIDTFTDVDRCLDFLNQIEKVKVFMIELNSIPSVSSVATRRDMKHGPKIKGVFTKIDMLCKALKEDTEQCDRSSVATNVTRNDLDHLEPSFIYTQLLKEILIEMDYDDKTKKEFVRFCRDLYQKDGRQLNVIDEFEHQYDKHTPIWWYTRECFTYQLLNRALRTQDVRILIKIGFFLRDVHRHIEQLHSESQYSDDVFLVNRGQGMLKDEFEKIKRCKGGLLAFNRFLSTSFDKNVSLAFARRALNNPQSVGILFKMTIDPRMSSAPFAKLDHVS